MAGAKITINGEVFNGEVALGGDRGLRMPVLHVVERKDGGYILDGDVPVPRIVLKIDSVVRMAWGALCEGASSAGCARHLREMPDWERINLLDRLRVERLERKCGDLNAIYASVDKSWNEAAHILMAICWGKSTNKGQLEELARRVRYSVVSRERGDIEQVEALLLGTSGLLDLYDDDACIRRLRVHFDHMRNKYSLTTMAPQAWRLTDINPSNHPVLRIAQLASLLAGRAFLFDDLVACRTVEDVQKIFRGVEASAYWSTHFIPGHSTDTRPKRVGGETANTLGINLVVTLMFAYGQWLGDEKLKDAAGALLEKIGPESNGIVGAWRAGGVHLESAADTQAILQLHNEYCLRRRCADCPVGRKVIKTFFSPRVAG